LKTAARLVTWTFFVRLLSVHNIVFLLLLVSILLTGLLALNVEQKGFAAAYAMSLPSSVNSFAMPIATLVSGSAHYNVWEATTYRFLHSTPPKGGILLPLRFVAKWLVVLLPLAGFLRSYSSISGEIETGVIQSLFSLPVRRSLLVLGKMIGDAMAAAVTLMGGMGLALFLAARATDLTYTSAQLARAFAFLGAMGGYAALFVFWGTAISAWARRSGKALLICTAIVIGVFLLASLLDNIFAINLRSHSSFHMPEMPPSVNKYLHDLSRGTQHPEQETPAELTTYLNRLHEYGIQVYGQLAAAYKTERLWNFVSPIQLALEIAAQLLQDEYRSAAEVFDMDRTGGTPPLSASLKLVIPELIWLSILCAGGLALTVILILRLEV